MSETTQSTPGKFVLSVHVDLRAVLAKLQSALQEAIDLVSFGLTVSEQAQLADNKVAIPGTWFSVATAQNEARTVAVLREEFPTWVLECGLRDCADEVGAFLEEVRLRP